MGSPMPKITNSTAPSVDHPALQGLTLLQRGWLSSNNVLLHGQGNAALLVDSGHVVHAAQTVALVRQALGGKALAAIVNTHLHSDHCGGNASLQAALGCRITVPAASFAAVQAWDEDRLSYRHCGQRCPRFHADAALAPGQSLVVGDRQWQALAAPGHDPDSLLLFDVQHGLLISADALWENGFGVVFPELEGKPGFDDVAAVLDLIESLQASCVIPGHGAPFLDVQGALHRARMRLAAFRADPARHRRHGIKVLAKYHLMEEQHQSWPAFLHWFSTTPLSQAIWLHLGRPEGSIAAFGEHIVQELLRGGVVNSRDGQLFDV
jgi:glyoxylase-like metal-dependent hydrolase (beta-lactamase superfamily II)